MPGWLSIPADLRGLDRAGIKADISAALVVSFVAVPQGVAYAMIAGLPPAMGLYAAGLPVIVGSLLRSSRHVVTGATNAVSLLVGGAGAALALQLGIPAVQVALSLALLVGIMQVAAGALRLGALVDYISKPVVLGYVTGAGVLIGVGQLQHATRSAGGSGDLIGGLAGWLQGLAATHWPSVALAGGSVLALWLMRWLTPRLPGPVVLMVGGIAAEGAFNLHQFGLLRVSDLADIPNALPPLALPEMSGWRAMLPVAAAATVLSLVESTAVARSLASRTGDRLNASVEFVGQGLANVVAACASGLPVSGSLARSTLNQQSGAQSRLSGVLSGVAVVLVVLTLGSVLGRTPIAILAGLVLVIASDLLDLGAIRAVLRSSKGDALAFLGTVAGTWVLRLDHAIYLGVAISVVSFLRRAAWLRTRPIEVGPRGHFRELGPTLEDGGGSTRSCSAVKLLHLEGALFFGSAGELRAALDEALRPKSVRFLILRLKRTHNLDITAAEVLIQTQQILRPQGRSLMLVGMRPNAMGHMERMGVMGAFGEDALFPTQVRWFAAMRLAVDTALQRVGPHSCGASCPLAEAVAHPPHPPAKPALQSADPAPLERP